MKYKNKIMSILAVFALVFAFTGIAQAAEKYKVGVSVPSADHGWTAGLLWWAKKAVAEIGKKDGDVEFFVVAASSGTKQVGDVEDLMIKGIDALVILPHNPATLQKVIEEAYAEGIYTVVVDRELATPAQDVFIAGDNAGLGRVGGEWLAKEMQGKGNVVVIEGMQIPINKQRVDAFNTVMAGHDGITILDSQPADWSTQKALAVMENFLQKHKHIDAVWCQDDDMLKGVLQAIKESGRTEIKTVLGGAGSKDIIKMILDDNPVVRSTVTYSPSMVASGIALAVAGVKDQTLGNMYHKPTRVILGAELVVKANAKDFYFPDAAF
ncbi:MAG: substrate-binding domain-containing protein [Pseudomonadales bacterium]|nr:substrate-binding domain-containing protein [Pseudomonadales bacterium]NRA18309.1 substrate-binding domain-containing protein [Oceanospirillaceae bacterium]